MPERLRVGVVLGGRSSEREISLESGRNVFYNLDPARFEGVPIFMDDRGGLWEIGLPLLVQNTTQDIAARLEHDATRLDYEDLRDRVDFVYIGLHGKYGEDGCFQGLLELLDVPYSGSGVLASALGMDKAVQRRVLRHAGIDVPATLEVTGALWTAEADSVTAAVAERFGYPCVVKPAREGCSTGLAVVAAPGELAGALSAALEWDHRALVEEYLDGIEVTVAVVGNENPHAFLPTETPPRGAYLTVEEKFLPGHGQNITPARLTDEQIAAVRSVAERAFVVLGLSSLARMDMYVTSSGRIVLGEPNTLPGASPSSTVFLGPMEEGIGPMALVTQVIDLSLAAQQTKKGPLG